MHWSAVSTCIACSLLSGWACLKQDQDMKVGEAAATFEAAPSRTAANTSKGKSQREGARRLGGSEAFGGVS